MNSVTVEPLRLGRKRRKLESKQEVTNESLGFLWDLLESEAPTKFYINDKKKAAFLLFPRWHFAASKNHHYLYMTSVGLLGKFTSEKKALAHLKTLIENANFPIKVFKVSKNGRNRGEFVPFAENMVQRMPLTENPTRVFNITRWGIAQ